MGHLLNKNILVAGGGRGIGLATSRRCAQEGARLLVSDLGCDRDGKGHDEKVVDKIVAELAKAGAEVEGDSSDLSSLQGIARVVRHFSEHFGFVDGGVFAPAALSRASLLRMSSTELDRVLQLQIRCAFHFVQALAQKAVEQKRPCSLVLFADARVWFGAQGMGANSLASGAICGFVRSASLEFRRYGVRVNAICPTARTRLTDDLPIFRRVSEDSLRPEHVADVVAYLLSDQALDVSGEVIAVSGSHISQVRVQDTPPVDTRSIDGDGFEGIAQAISQLRRLG